MEVRVASLTSMRAQRALHAACVLQKGAPCTPQSAVIVKVLFLLACSAGGRDREELPAASRGVAQLQVGMLSGVNLMGSPGSCCHFQPASAASHSLLVLLVQPRQRSGAKAVQLVDAQPEGAPAAL